MSKIEVNNVYKIFGTDPLNVLPMVKKGAAQKVIKQLYKNYSLTTL